ncbi:sigma-54-dependent Fis family transcriptional regulator [Marinilabiliaceae bacterium JC040]|nr:sigma-54-dependent Fis family transcriptional regulator [Marinilabiliaceae bacterium JC040]
MKDSSILIVDDNKGILTALEFLLQPMCKFVKTTSSPNMIPSIMRENSFNVVLLDMNFSAGLNTGNEGLYWLNRINEIDSTCSVILITAYGDVELAVKAVKEGAFDFVLKPWDNAKLIATLNAAIQFNNSKREISSLKEKEKGLKQEITKDRKNIIGSSPKLLETLKVVRKVAKTDVNVLITGENGTGKDLIAHELYSNSKRNNDVFVSVDMGAISETLFESELFGHVKGAFTDAKDDRIGKIELANGGTLFLDEIANISLPLQAKLLRVLQNRTLTRVGSNKEIQVDLRLICATNGNLQELVDKGLFREDLLYRINTISIDVPALRDRLSDISLLSDFFIEKYCKKYSKPLMKLNSKALAKLEEYAWPGNVRELQHAIEKAVILSDDIVISKDDFHFKTSSNKLNPNSEKEVMTIEEMEKKMIVASIDNNEGNLSAVASQLGITRQTLYNKLKKYKL